MPITPITYRAGLGRKLTIAEMDGNFQYLEDNIAIVPDITYFHKSGLIFTVRATLYPIAGQSYTSPETDVTLDTADGTFDRIDLIIANTSGVTTKITGTASATPAPPDFDENTEYAIVFVLVKAGATTPDGVSTIDIYKENIEWTATETTSGARINLASTNDPNNGTKSIEASSVITGDIIRLTPSSAVNTVDISTVLLRIKLKAALPDPGSINLRFYDATGVVSNRIIVKDGNYGLDNTNTSSYQTIVIPANAWGFTALQITYLEIRQFQSVLGWFMDDIEYQKGIETAGGDFLPTGGYAGTAADLKTLIDDIIKPKKETFTATANQTVFNLSTTPNNVDVFRGRNFMLSSEYSLAGSAVTTTTGMPVGTIITVRKF